eukprot:m.22023 g.22023  ORF g.22023 m.22023 type:complete len:206 (+) comp8345_c0_seq2:391-1008(+)
MASSRPPSHAPSHDGGRRPRDMRAAIQRHDLSPSPSVKQQPEGYRAPSYLPPPYCPIRSDIYEKLSSPVGKGQFGAVWKCVNRRTRETCALKKVLMKNETEGFPLTALREIMLMSSLDHPNVLCLKEVVRSARKNAHYHVHPLSLSVVVCSMCCRSPRCHVSYTLLACCMIGKGNVAATASTTQPMHALRMGMDVGSFGLQPTAW